MGTRLGTTLICPVKAAILQHALETNHPSPNPTYIASLLAEGYKFHIKYAGGRNLAKATRFELDQELTRLNLNLSSATYLVREAANFCIRMEKSEEDGRGNFPQRLQGCSVELAELNKLRSNAKLLDDFLRFKNLQLVLRKIKDPLFHEGKPAAPLSGDKIAIMQSITAAGFSIPELEGVIAFWKDGLLVPPVMEGGVNLSDLMDAAKAEGIID